MAVMETLTPHPTGDILYQVAPASECLQHAKKEIPMKRASVPVHGTLATRIILILALIAVITVSAGFTQTAAPVPAGTASAASPGRFTTFAMDTEAIDGYTLWLPPGWKPGGGWPLILSLHSAAEVGGAIEMASTTGAVGAIQDGGEVCAKAVGDWFIVLAPHLRQADYAKAQWYLYPGIIKALLNDAVKTWGADPRRIYAIGYSTGGAGEDHMIIAETSDSLTRVPRIYLTFQVYFHDHAGSFFHPQIYDWMLSHVNPRKAKKVVKALSR